VLVAIAACASQILVTAHLRCGRGRSGWLSVLCFNKYGVRKGRLPDFILQDRTTIDCSQERVKVCSNSATHLAALLRLTAATFSSTLPVCLSASVISRCFPLCFSCKVVFVRKPSHQASANVVALHSARLTTLSPLTMSAQHKP
jgi:hypothetical protein